MDRFSLLWILNTADEQSGFNSVDSSLKGMWKLQMTLSALSYPITISNFENLGIGIGKKMEAFGEMNQSNVLTFPKFLFHSPPF